MAAIFGARRALRASLSSSPSLLRITVCASISNLSRFSQWEKPCFVNSRPTGNLNNAQILVSLRTVSTSAPDRVNGEFYHDSNTNFDYNSRGNSHHPQHSYGSYTDYNTNHQGYYGNNMNNPGQPYQSPNEYQNYNQGANFPNVQQSYSYGGATNWHYNNEYNQQTGYDSGQPYQDPNGNGYSQQYHEYPNTYGTNNTIEELEELCKQGNIKEAIAHLPLLERNSTVIPLPTYFCLIEACGDFCSLEEARAVHEHISRTMSSCDVSVHNKILDMYVKCGSMSDAKKMFDEMPERDMVSWGTIISGFAKNGLGEDAIDAFTKFKQLGLAPDNSIFLSVFFACGIIGAIDEGMLHFKSMVEEFGITPSMEHYVSIVSMLGQSGYMDEALEFIEQMPVEPSVDIWENLMNLARLNGYLEIGDRCAQIVAQLDPARLDEKSKSGLVPIKDSDLEKERERSKASRLEHRHRQYEYKAGDRSHPEHEKIYEQLRRLKALMKEAGYVPDTRFVLHDVDQESKEEALLAHSERLAVGYALLTSPARSTIRIIKNLRSCGDCHTALKLISKIVGRQITARDAKRFHHFNDGVCTCNDYW